MKLFDALRQDLETYLDQEQIKKIHEAFLLAEEAHKDQRRVSGEQYIMHPVAVAEILAGMHMDAESICAAILHDVLEDTPVEKSTLTKKFGEQVATLVDGVSKLTQIKFENKAEAQSENFRKMLLAMVKDIRVILIKLADRLHNMRTIGSLRSAKQRRIARETLEIYSPIANRLGMHKFTIEFENLGFAALYPLRCRIIKDAVQKARGHRKEIMREIDRALRECLEKRDLTMDSILGREKHLYSLYKKMRDRKVSFSEIMDVYAFRIVVGSIDECYRVLGMVHQLYKPVPGRFKDYIAIPKANSYQSLHTTLFGPYGLPIEIQIRTDDMEHTAEEGIAAHWIYKSSNRTPDDAQVKARAWLKGLMELQENTKNPLEFIESVKIDLFPDEVYVFTPRGKIMELPAGATAVDFAYAVHTDIGNSCIAVKINRRIAPLSTVLSNGQSVEVITAPGARPNLAWLNFVVTGKARSNIRHATKDQKRAESILFGKQLLEKSLAPFSSEPSSITEAQWDAVLEQYDVKDKETLFEEIGLGNQLPALVARYLMGDQSAGVTLERSDARALQIKGSQGTVVAFAECCRPIPGDPIVGVFNPGKGLAIHTEQCERAAKLCRNPESCIAVCWEDEIDGEFKVDLTIEVANQRGVLAQLANDISSTNANIDDISVDMHEGRFNIIHLMLSVKNRKHLAQIMRRIRANKVVIKLTRKK